MNVQKYENNFLIHLTFIEMIYYFCKELLEFINEI